MTQIIPVASGKGGTGKTLFVTNLGITLALKRKTVVLVDLDLGGSNLHTCLGIRNTHPGLGNFIYKQEENLESLLVETGIPRLHFIPGDSLLPGTANMEFFIKKRIITGIEKIPADYVILDLGAGAHFNVVDFFLISPSGLIVTTPETTSILNAYSLLKTILFRLLYRSFPQKSEERKMVIEFISHRFESSDLSFYTLIDKLEHFNSEAGKTARNMIKSLFPRIILNMGRTQQDLNIGVNLRKISHKNLGIDMEFIGFILKDDEIVKSIFNRKPYCLSHPQSPYAASVSNIAEKIIHYTPRSPLSLFEANEDLKELNEILMRS